MTENTAVALDAWEGQANATFESTDTMGAEDRLAAPVENVASGLEEKPDGLWTNFSPAGTEADSATTGWVTKTKDPIYLPKKTPHPRTHFICLEKREGVVLEVLTEEFTARLVDTLNEEPDVTATFSFADLSDDGLRLLKEGAVFYWNVGYSVSPGGQRSRVADLVFRRLPARQKSDVTRARRRAEQIRNDLGLDE